MKTWELDGQPDSIAVSPDEMYVAIAIENERDEDLGDGEPPQMPPGSLQIVTMAPSLEDYDSWTIQTVDLTGLDGSIFPEDPEPEYVSINEDNVAVVTLQENNGLVLVDLATGDIVGDYSAGDVDLTMVDIIENDFIDPSGSLTAVPREPDAVTWIGTDYFATANEGDLYGGSRGFSIFDTAGNVVYDSGNILDHLLIQHGHYPEGRSENKGGEPEGILYADFDGTPYLFVTSERGSVIFVYDVSDVTAPMFKQLLPSNAGPEGLLAIPERNLLIASCEVDERDNGMRGAVVVYHLQEADQPAYPMMASEMKDDGTPIAFSALSGLTAAADGTLWSVQDSFYARSKLVHIDPSSTPYKVVNEVFIVDSDDVFANAVAGLPAAADLINADKTINVDLEGISEADDGTFWLVHEGRGTIGDVDRPVETPNVLFHVKIEDGNAVIVKVILPPAFIMDKQVRFGYEGVAVDGKYVVVAFQRPLVGEDTNRLGVYDTESETWGFVYYPTDEPTSQYGGWVGLGDISNIPGEMGGFLVLERDNRAGPDASIKKIYKIMLDYDAIDFDGDDMSDVPVLTKTEFRDVLGDLAASNGPVPDKVEGLTVDMMGHVWINNDNDGVDDNSGEQFLLDLGMLIEVGDDDGEGGDDDGEGGDDDAGSSVASVGALLACVASSLAVLFTH